MIVINNFLCIYSFELCNCTVSLQEICLIFNHLKKQILIIRLGKKNGKLMKMEQAQPAFYTRHRQVRDIFPSPYL